MLTHGFDNDRARREQIAKMVTSPSEVLAVKFLVSLGRDALNGHGGMYLGVTTPTSEKIRASRAPRNQCKHLSTVRSMMCAIER